MINGNPNDSMFMSCVLSLFFRYAAAAVTPDTAIQPAVGADCAERHQCKHKFAAKTSRIKR
jgi:hypothetical protein